MQPDPPATHRRRGPRWPVWVGAVVLLVVAGVVATDTVFRAVAQNQISDQIEQQLPEGVSGDVSVAIGGWSFLWQWTTGRLERVTLHGEELTYQGVPFDAEVTATGVPTQMGGTIEHVEMTAAVTADSFQRIVRLPENADLQLGNGTIAYTQQVALLGIPASLRVTAEVILDWPELTFVPTAVEAGSAGAMVDLNFLLDLAGQRSINVCAAAFLPAVIEVDDVQVSEQGVRVHAVADQVVASDDAIRTLGAC